VLAELRICDLAIIDELELNFGPGFSVLTGETGAGKSIIIDAVDLVLGGRADSSVVRAGSDRALVEATFRLSADGQRGLAAVLQREGLESDDPAYLLLAREVRLVGRNVCRVNGRSVTLALLRELATGLVDIHGQSEHLSLLHARNQLDLLDRYADLLPLRAEVASLVRQIGATRAELDSLSHHEQELAHRVDLLQFQIGEIESAALRVGEDDELLAERVRLSNAEQLSELAVEALNVLEESSDETPAVLDLLGTAVRALTRLARIDASLAQELSVAETVTYQIEELGERLRGYLGEIEFNPKRLQAVEDRLNLIHRLERKYGTTIGTVLDYAAEAAAQLDRITHSEERIAELEKLERQQLKHLGERTAVLSAERRAAAQSLAAGIEAELGDLRLEGARFGVSFSWRLDAAGVPVPARAGGLEWCVSRAGEECVGQAQVESDAVAAVAFDAAGIDRVEFVVTTNPGEPLKPMAKVASGGETSRLMLALKTVLSRADGTPTLIFDEIDQGIGGRIGATVGHKLWALTAPGNNNESTESTGHQVLCVTHLPQLAGFGDTHLRVEKDVVGERSVTRVHGLDGADRIQELAQMLGGAGDATVRSAEELLVMVEKYKAHGAARGVAKAPTGGV